MEATPNLDPPIENLASAPHARPRPVVRLAGVVVGLVGVGNVVLGALGMLTDELRLDASAATSLMVLGAVTLALGVLVATGRRWAIGASLAVFGGLFAIQAFGATGGDPAPAAVTLAVVVLPLVLALRATRRAAPPV